MPRFSDDDVRAVMQSRAAGRPRPGLRQRIRLAAVQSQEPRIAHALPLVAHRRTILLRFSAIGGLVAVLVLAPLAGALSDSQPPIDAQTGDEPRDAAIAIAADQEDDDGEVDDEDQVDEDQGDADDDDDDEEDDEEDGDDSAHDAEDDEDDEDPDGSGEDD